jgi:hypothetical protein
MDPLTRGLYETLLTEALAAELTRLAPALREGRDALRSAEAADRLSLHVARIVRRLIATVDEKERVAVGVRLTRSLINGLGKIAQEKGSAAAVDRGELPLRGGEMLRSIAACSSTDRPRRSDHR